MKKELTELVSSIDKSDSMSGWEDDTIGGFDSMLREQQAVDSTLCRMKEALAGINEGIEEMKDFFHAAEVNGGKIPNVNEILHQVLSESHEGNAEIK